MNIESIKAAREPIEYEIELRKVRGFEPTPLSDEQLQTILSCLSACEKISAVDGDRLIEAIDESDFDATGYKSSSDYLDNHGDIIDEVIRLVADIKKGGV